MIRCETLGPPVVRLDDGSVPADLQWRKHQQEDERRRAVTHLHKSLRWWNRLMRAEIAETSSSTSKAMSGGALYARSTARR